MKLLNFSLAQEKGVVRMGAYLSARRCVVDLAAAWEQYAGRSRQSGVERFPGSMLALITAGEPLWDAVRRLLAELDNSPQAGPASHLDQPITYPLEAVSLHAPLERPPSLRDFYAFEQHVVTAFANRDRQVPPEWYRAPVFYYSNPNAILAPNAALPCPVYTQELDYELEIACIISRPGRDILASQAESYIFGYTILNDWSARDEQRWEMRVGLGPAKGKDFASSLGPWIVTPDELSAKHTRRAGVYDLAMSARVNGEQRSRGNWKDLHYSFGQMIERASAQVWLLPGDVIGSGTVGSGCLLETTRGLGPWLQPGDLVELEIEGLGVLANTITLPGQ